MLIILKITKLIWINNIILNVISIIIINIIKFLIIKRRRIENIKLVKVI